MNVYFGVYTLVGLGVGVFFVVRFVFNHGRRVGQLDAYKQAQESQEAEIFNQYLQSLRRAND